MLTGFVGRPLFLSRKNASRRCQGRPTSVVTLWGSSITIARPPEIETADLAARLPLDDVTHGVRLHGAAPAMNSDSDVALLLLLIATTATVPSAGFV
jgi:hypothetical protein